MKFGLQSIKILALICTAFVTCCAVALIVVGIPYRNKWVTATPYIGNHFQVPMDFALFYGICLLVVSIFGYVAICLNGYGMMIIYNILLGIAFFTALIFGILMSSDAKNEHSKYIYKLVLQIIFIDCLI